MLACHLFECSQYIVDNDKSFVTLYGILLLVNDCIRATLVESCLSKLITVERFAFSAKNMEPAGQLRESVVACLPALR